MDAVPLAEDVRLHLGVPAGRLVSEVELRPGGSSRCDRNLGIETKKMFLRPLRTRRRDPSARERRDRTRHLGKHRGHRHGMRPVRTLIDAIVTIHLLSSPDIGNRIDLARTPGNKSVPL